MFNINSIFFLFLAVSSLGIMCVIMLVCLNRTQKHTIHLLTLGLLCQSFVLIFYSFVFIDKFFLFFPYLWRVGLPFQYLIAPLFYLYVRACLNNEIAFRKWDWLHFMPALFHFMELTPFYFMPTPEKLDYIKYAFSHTEILVQQKEGILPAYIHPFLKIGMGIVYQVFQVRLLVRFYRSDSQWLKNNRIIWNWLKRLTVTNSLKYVILFVAFVLHKYVDLLNYIILSIGVVLFCSALLLIFNPSVLYGILGCLNIPEILEVEDEIEPSPKKFTPSSVKTDECKEKLESFITKQKPFLVKNYSIRQLAADCDMPVHHLSIVINREYGINYADFINRYRIDYIITHRYDENYRQFSLEGLSSEAGFNSRSTFINAFKKVTNQTPSVYFAQKSNLN